MLEKDREDHLVWSCKE